jgi:hypothetical protein
MRIKLYPDSDRQHNQAGVTLLLAILVLAAITAIAFSLAAIVTIEIRSSGDVLRTEPALYAVQGVTEEAFFKYTRSVPNSALDIAANDPAGETNGCTSTSSNVCLINGVALDQPLPAVRQYDPAPRVDLVYVSNRYLFFDPNEPNNFAQSFDSVSVTMLNSVSGATAVFSKCCDTGGNIIPVRTYNMNQNTTYTEPTTGVGQYELVVNNPTSTPLLAQIDAVRTSDSAHVIPLLNKTMDITASYLGLRRKYTIQIPQ